MAALSASSALGKYSQMECSMSNRRRSMEVEETPASSLSAALIARSQGFHPPGLCLASSSPSSAISSSAAE